MGYELVGQSGYFQANNAGWRFILRVIESVYDDCHLNLPEGWHRYDAGLKSQEQCDELANALEAKLQSGINLSQFAEESGPSLDPSLGPNVRRFLSDPRFQLYRSDDEMIRKFIRFLRKCGGEFVIL
jgi:hypothetical protein